jgi:hypothetical protein
MQLATLFILWIENDTLTQGSFSILGQETLTMFSSRIGLKLQLIETLMVGTISTFLIETFGVGRV